jgi:hypothetical protein
MPKTIKFVLMYHRQKLLDLIYGVGFRFDVLTAVT